MNGRTCNRVARTLVLACALAAGGAVHAALITNGFTYAVASSGDTNVGTHFHSNTGGAFGNPAGKAEVGRFATEEVRGLSEYRLTALSPATSAFVTFNVFKEGGLFVGTNDTPFTGRILVDAYIGNNLEDISDYQAASQGAVGSFLVDPVALNVGDIFSFDITALFNAAVARGDASLGIRLREDRANAQYALSRAWTFDNFRLTSDNQTTVPEPATLALAVLALGLIGAGQRRRSGSAV